MSLFALAFDSEREQLAYLLPLCICLGSSNFERSVPAPLCSDLFQKPPPAPDIWLLSWSPPTPGIWDYTEDGWKRIKAKRKITRGEILSMTCGI